jgi:UDP-N-acetylglucosamine:LPS N-acetylglucosamine transferase
MAAAVRSQARTAFRVGPAGYVPAVFGRAGSRWLVVTASMGAGHSQVAAELAARLRAASAEVVVVDLLELLPSGIGPGLRAGYAGMLRAAPWLYDWIFRTYFLDHDRSGPGVYPLDVLGARRLAPLVARHRPCAVVSTFHLAGQVAGWLRVHGRLPCPSVVAITEPSAHRQWLHPGSDLFLCPYPWVARHAFRDTGIPATAPGPVVAARFHRPGHVSRGRAALGLAPGERAVLVSAGSWGVGRALHTAARLRALPGVRTVVLCGRNERLRERVRRTLPGCTALGWRDDLPDLFAASAVLVDQSGGSTCAEAFAAGLPVVLHEPLPGHGELGARALAAAGVVWWAKDTHELLVAVDELSRPGPARERQLAHAAGLFARDPVEILLDWRATLPGFDPDAVPATIGEPVAAARTQRWARWISGLVGRRRLGGLAD